jgi:hypothetical protein
VLVRHASPFSALAADMDRVEQQAKHDAEGRSSITRAQQDDWRRRHHQEE